MSNTLEQYLGAAIDRGQIDHVLRASRSLNGKVTFYVRPLNGDGETLDFVVRGNGMALNLTSDSDVHRGIDGLLETRIPILDQITDLCHAIEKCGASPELTDAVTKASALRKPITELVEQAISLGLETGLFSFATSEDPAQGEAVPQSATGCSSGSDSTHQAIQLGHCAANAAQSLSELTKHTNAHDATKAMERLVKALASKATSLLVDQAEAKQL